jgi:PAS domain S-box-containing protein
MDAIRDRPQQTDPNGTGTGAIARPSDTKPVSHPDLPSMGLAIEAGKIGVWSCDVASNALTWSPSFGDIHRLPPGQFDGPMSSYDDCIHADDRARVGAAVQNTLRTHAPYSVEYRLSGVGEGDERWIAASGTVVVVDAIPVRLVGVCEDVTERVRTEKQLRLRASQQAVVARLGARALVEDDLQKLLDETVATVAEMLEVDYVKILELLPGDIELLLRAGIGWNAGLVGTALVSTGHESQAGFSLSANTPIVVEELSADTRFNGSSLLRDHGVVSGMTTKIAGPDGRSYGVIGVHTARRRKFNAHDVSLLTSVANIVAGAIQRHQSDQRNELMIRELRHRSGNLFSQLLALFSQTASHSRTVAELTAKYEARVLAHANAHRLITEGGWKATALDDLLRTMLAADVDRVSMTGPNVVLDPDIAFALSTVLHELATNARKHGSLSTSSGRLELSWSVDRAERGLTLSFEWQERHGPAPKRRRRPGFGSRLIEIVIERQLSGTLQQSFDPAGRGPPARRRQPISTEPPAAGAA